MTFGASIEKRKAGRRSCSMKAQIRAYDNAPPVDCIVTDYSEAGANLVLPSGYEAPSAFDLYLPLPGETRSALLRWNTDHAVGVEFTQSRKTDDERLTGAFVQIEELAKRLASVEARNDEIVSALNQTVTMLERVCQRGAAV